MVQTMAWLPEPILTKLHDAIWRHQTTISYLERALMGFRVHNPHETHRTFFYNDGLPRLFNNEMTN